MAVPSLSSRLAANGDLTLYFRQSEGSKPQTVVFTDGRIRSSGRKRDPTFIVYDEGDYCIVLGEDSDDWEIEADSPDSTDSYDYSVNRRDLELSVEDGTFYLGSPKVPIELCLSEGRLKMSRRRRGQVSAELRDGLIHLSQTHQGDVYGKTLGIGLENKNSSPFDKLRHWLDNGYQFCHSGRDYQVSREWSIVNRDRDQYRIKARDLYSEYRGNSIVVSECQGSVPMFTLHPEGPPAEIDDHLMAKYDILILDSAQ